MANVKRFVYIGGDSSTKWTSAKQTEYKDAIVFIDDRKTIWTHEQEFGIPEDEWKSIKNTYWFNSISKKGGTSYSAVAGSTNIVFDTNTGNKYLKLTVDSHGVTYELDVVTRIPTSGTAADEQIPTVAAVKSHVSTEVNKVSVTIDTNSDPYLEVTKSNRKFTVKAKAIDIQNATEESTGLADAYDVKDYVDSSIRAVENNLTGALHYLGISTTDPKITITIGGQVIESSTLKKGDVISYHNKEYVNEQDGINALRELGDEGSYAVKGSIKNADIASDAAIDQSKISGLVGELRDLRKHLGMAKTTINTKETGHVRVALESDNPNVYTISENDIASASDLSTLSTKHDELSGLVDLVELELADSITTVNGDGDYITTTKVGKTVTINPQVLTDLNIEPTAGKRLVNANAVINYVNLVPTTASDMWEEL